MAMPTAASREADVEAELLCSQSGQQRTDERAQVDAQVEEGEAGVATLVVGGVQGADQGRRVRLDATAAEGDEHQPDADAGVPGKGREGEVTEHDQHRGVEERTLRADEPVGHPGPDDRATGRPRRRTHRRSRRPCPGDPEAASSVRVVEVERQDALHAVEAEPLPQLDAEQVGQYAWLAQESPLVVLRLLGDVGHADHDGTRGARDGSTERVILRVSRPGVWTAVRTADARTTARRCRRPRRRPAAPRAPTRPIGAGD